MTMKRKLMAATICLLLSVPQTGATVIETYNKAFWQATVENWTTIDFTGWPSFTTITTQYADEGVVFTDGNDYILSGFAAFPNDGKGLNSNEGSATGRITAQFMSDMYWVAVDHPTEIRMLLYRYDQLIYTSNEFYDDISRFAGIISTEPFDRIVILRLGDTSVAIDDLFFGAPIPAPGSMALLGLTGLVGRQGRTRAN